MERAPPPPSTRPKAPVVTSHRTVGGGTVQVVQHVSDQEGVGPAAMVKKLDAQLKKTLQEKTELFNANKELLSRVESLTAELYGRLEKQEAQLKEQQQKALSAAAKEDGEGDVKSRFLRFVDEVGKKKEPERDYKLELERLQTKVILQEKSHVELNAMKLNYRLLEDRNQQLVKEIQRTQDYLQQSRMEINELRESLAEALAASEHPQELQMQEDPAKTVHVSASSKSADHPFDDLFGDEDQKPPIKPTAVTVQGKVVGSSNPAKASGSGSGGGGAIAKHLKALQEEVDRLRSSDSELRTLRETAADREASMNMILVEHDALQTKCKQLTDEKEGLHAQVTRLSQGMSEVGDLRDKLEEERRIRRQLETLASSSGGKGNVGGASDAALAEANLKIKALQEEIEVLGLHQQQHEIDQQCLADQLQDARTRNNLLQDQLASMKESFAQLEVEQAANTVAVSDSDSWRRRAHNAEDSVGLLTRELSDLKEHHTKIVTSNAIALRALRSMAKTAWNRAEYYARTTAELNLVKTRVLRLEKDYEGAVGSLKATTAAKDEAVEALAHAQQRLEDVEAEAAMQVKQAKNRVKDLQATISRQETELSSLGSLAHNNNNSLASANASVSHRDPSSAQHWRSPSGASYQSFAGDTTPPASMDHFVGDTSVTEAPSARQHDRTGSYNQASPMRDRLSFEGEPAQQSMTSPSLAALPPVATASREELERLVQSLKEDNERKGALIVSLVEATGRSSTGSATAFKTMQSQVNSGSTTNGARPSSSWSMMKKLKSKVSGSSGTSSSTTKRLDVATVSGLQQLLEEKLSENIALQARVEQLEAQQAHLSS